MGDEASSWDLSSSSKDNLAVALTNVYKDYSSFRSTFHVIKNVNLSVPKGTIYGLLGPSGCGKTTLLRCVVGRLPINGGTISVLGNPPGARFPGERKSKLGYMPQDMGLMESLTIMQTLRFYAAISGISSKKAKARIEFLVGLLHIPTNDGQRFNQLSGGQKRRTSLAVALLHEPELLILDEPTVGVDPVLRKSIWDYLNNLITASNTTIIITTHYIEEARMANNVGLMLDGELLAEAPPQQLMEQHGVSTLESVFLKLCLTRVDFNDSNEECDLESEYNHQKESISAESGDDGSRQQQKPLMKANSKSKCGKKCLDSLLVEIPSGFRIKPLFVRNWQAFIGFPAYFGFEVILPTILIFIFGLVIGKPLFGLEVAVVNHDSQNLGQLFLDMLDKRVVIQVPYENYDDALRDVKMGVVRNAIFMNSSFSEAVKNRYKLGSLVDDISLDASSISCSMDVSNQIVSLSIQKEFFMAYGRFSRTVLAEMGMNPLSGDIPLKHEEKQVYGDFNVSYDQFMLPSFFIIVTFYMSMGLTSLAIVIEKQTGSYERILLTGVLSIEYILALIICQFQVLLMQVFLMLFSAFAIIGYTCLGSYLLIAVLPLLQGVCGMSLGVLISSICDDQVTAMMINIGIYFFSMLTQGLLWPIEGMSYFLKPLFMLTPQTYASDAMRSIMNRGWDITYPTVYYAFIITTVWSCVFITLAWIVARYKK